MISVASASFSLAWRKSPLSPTPPPPSGMARAERLVAVKLCRVDASTRAGGSERADRQSCGNVTPLYSALKGEE